MNGLNWGLSKILRNRILPAPSFKSGILLLLKSRRLNLNILPSSYSLPNLLGCQVPNKPSSASYSFSGRRKVGAPSEDLSMSPGPAKYDIINPDIYHKRQPSFSIQKRTKRPDYSSAIPGPGTYSPEKFYMHLRKPPSFTMGVRHSEFVTPLVVDVLDWQIQYEWLVFIQFFTQMWSGHTII